MVNVFDGIPNLQANQHGMCLIDQTNHDGTLLHCFLCILYLKYPTLRGASLEQQVSPSIFKDLNGELIQGDRIVVVVVSEHLESLSWAILCSKCKFIGYAIISWSGWAKGQEFKRKVDGETKTRYQADSN